MSWTVAPTPMIRDDCCTGEGCEDPAVTHSLPAFTGAVSLRASCCVPACTILWANSFLSLPEIYFLKAHQGWYLLAWGSSLQVDLGLVGFHSSGTRIPLDIMKGFWTQRCWFPAPPPNERPLDIYHLLWNLEKWYLGLKNRTGEVKGTRKNKQCVL